MLLDSFIAHLAVGHILLSLSSPVSMPIFIHLSNGFDKFSPIITSATICESLTVLVNGPITNLKGKGSPLLPS
jgi:hypothetical protein